ncbi:hypothetical protein TNCV_4655111 [Trichonephila clavipes]|nr:hypothetical protein TNCV_4655111 [Trichonephila clavipes]
MCLVFSPKTIVSANLISECYASRSAKRPHIEDWFEEDDYVKFEETGSLGVLPGRGRKPVGTETVEEVTTAMVERATSSLHLFFRKWPMSVTRVGDSVVDSTNNSAIHFEMLSV